jgi:hypothetical protein
MVAFLLLIGCAINQSVTPVTGERPSEVCVARNETVHMEGFHAELVRQIEARGIDVRSYDGAAPADCRHSVQYTANWRWDLAMYLSYAQVQVFDGGRLVGTAIYDATQGGANMGKFGATSEKISPLIAELFG